MNNYYKYIDEVIQSNGSIEIHTVETISQDKTVKNYTTVVKNADGTEIVNSRSNRLQDALVSVDRQLEHKFKE